MRTGWRLPRWGWPGSASGGCGSRTDGGPTERGRAGVLVGRALEVRFGPLAHAGLPRLGIAGLLALAVARAPAPMAALGGAAPQPPPGFICRALQPVLDLWNSPEYGRRFIIAMVLWLGVPASGLTDLLPGVVRRALVVVLAVGGAALGGWAFGALRTPFAVRYAQAILPGWGVVAFIAGLTIASIAQAIAALRERQAAPEAR